MACQSDPLGPHAGHQPGRNYGAQDPGRSPYPASRPPDTRTTRPPNSTSGNGRGRAPDILHHRVFGAFLLFADCAGVSVGPRYTAGPHELAELTGRLSLVRLSHFRHTVRSLSLARPEPRGASRQQDLRAQDFSSLRLQNERPSTHDSPCLTSPHLPSARTVDRRPGAGRQNPSPNPSRISFSNPFATPPDLLPAGRLPPCPSPCIRPAKDMSRAPIPRGRSRSLRRRRPCRLPW